MQRSIGVYLHRDVLILHSQRMVNGGFNVGCEPIVRLQAPVVFDEAGHAMRIVFDGYRDSQTDMVDWKKEGQSFLKAAGFRSWKALQENARSCWVWEEGKNIVFQPLENGGSQGSQKGFHPFGRPQNVVPQTVSDSELGKALMQTLMESK